MLEILDNIPQVVIVSGRKLGIKLLDRDLRAPIITAELEACEELHAWKKRR
jgi:hypothetical protein